MGGLTAAVPRRIQRRRARGWRMPDGAIYVGRPTKWGNPYRVGDPAGLYAHDGLQVDIALTRELAVVLYRASWETRLNTAGLSHRQWADAVGDLAGHDLACWCPLNEPCHADVLLELANPGLCLHIDGAPT